MTRGTKPPWVQLVSALVPTVLFVALLVWALFAPGRAHARASRPPLLTPVTLDWLMDPKPLPTVTPAKATPGKPASPPHDGLKAW